MSEKVIWCDGLFIRPQHFQQQERYLLQQLDNRTRSLFPFAYGFSEFEINIQELDFGQISLTACAGIFQDGTTFNAPQSDSLPLSISVSESLNDAMVYLVLPKKDKTQKESGNDEHSSSIIRYLRKTKKLPDLSSDDGKEVDVDLGELRIRLIVETKSSSDDGHSVPDGYLKLPVAHIEEVRSARIRLSENFIPPVICFDKSPKIVNLIRDIHSMVAARGAELALRLANTGGKGGVTEVTDFLLLQVLNRIEPLLKHYKTVWGLHPIYLYQFLLGAAGELSTFMKSNKRPISFPHYSHEDLNGTFVTIFNDIKESFSVVLVQPAEAIPLSPPNKGFRAARIMNPAILDSADFVIAVSAQVSDDKIRSQFPMHIKVAPGERIYELVHGALPGIEISVLPVAPREIPYNAGFTYFIINKHNSMWQELKSSQGMAFHVSGDYPELEMQMWSINR